MGVFMQENSIIGEDLTQNAKLVSIIVPIYNASEYLKKCIMSILNQTYNNIEVTETNKIEGKQIYEYSSILPCLNR